MSMELNTFDPTYFNFIEIAFNMRKWEPNYHIGASPALKVTAPYVGFFDHVINFAMISALEFPI